MHFKNLIVLRFLYSNFIFHVTFVASILQNLHENFVKPTDCRIRVLACGHLRHYKSCLQTFSLGWKMTETKRIQKGDERDNGFFLPKDCRGLAVVPRGTDDTI
jgi:hypothetical protein